MRGTEIMMPTNADPKTQETANSLFGWFRSVSDQVLLKES